MKYYILCIVIFLAGCVSSMPLQGLSTANYAYKPPNVYTSTYESNINSGNCQQQPQLIQYDRSINQSDNLNNALRNNCYQGNSSRYSSRRTSTYTQPENAFESTKESFRNLNSISQYIEQIYKRVR